MKQDFWTRVLGLGYQLQQKLQFLRGLAQTDIQHVHDGMMTFHRWYANTMLIVVIFLGIMQEFLANSHIQCISATCVVHGMLEAVIKDYGMSVATIP